MIDVHYINITNYLGYYMSIPTHSSEPATQMGSIWVLLGFCNKDTPMLKWERSWIPHCTLCGVYKCPTLAAMRTV